MIRNLAIFSALALTACAYGTPSSTYPEYQPRPGQGQYVRPANLAPQPTPMIPAVDACQSQLYQGLLGQHEGAIFIAGLPGRKRVIKPARLEGFGYNPDDALYDRPPFVEVRDYLAGQSLYAPSISNMMDRLNLGPVIEDRLTIELDAEGYVQTLDCR
ncbi:MAG: hypothetical protein ABJO36_07305 [Litorimonas sp.]